MHRSQSYGTIIAMSNRLAPEEFVSIIRQLKQIYEHLRKTPIKHNAQARRVHT